MDGKTKQRVLAAGVVALLLVGGALWLAARPRAFAIGARFKEAQGVRRGQKVMFKGVPIGEVGAVELTKAGDVRIALALDPEHRELIKEGATAYIGANSLVSVTNEKSVELYNADDGGKPLAAGAELVGMNSYLELKSWQAARWGESVSGGMAKRATEWYEKARESFASKESDPETDRLLKDLKEAAERKAADLEARLPELEERYRKLYARIKEGGGTAAAEKLQRAWDEFQKAVAGTQEK